MWVAKLHLFVFGDTNDSLILKRFAPLHADSARMHSCHNIAVFIRVARAAHGMQVPTSRGYEDGRKRSGGKFSDMSAHQGEEAQNAI